MDIDEEIMGLIDELGDNFQILNYVYNEKKFIPGKSSVYYSGPYWDKREIAAAIKTLLVGKWISSGENVYQFENKFAQKINQKYAVMVNSGSSANLVLIASLKKHFGWNDGSEIIVSPCGFPTTIAPIAQNNLVPIFVDITFDDLNFDLNLIEGKITNKSVAIFVSPVLGNPPDFDKLLEICHKHNLELILDNCDSLGSTWNNKFLNEFSYASSYSLYPAHHLSCGEGGLVASNNEEVVRFARSFAWWSRECSCVGSANLLPNGVCGHRFDKWLPEYDSVIDHKYVFSTGLGYNLKPLDLQGSIGLVQLTKWDEIHSKRKHSKNVITDLFAKHMPQLKTLTVLNQANVSWFGTPFICENKEQKDKIVNHLEKNKIQTRNYFSGNILMHGGYKHLGNYKDYPLSNLVLDKVFFLGASPSYSSEVFNYIEDVLKKYE
jgi:CDP-6-deoxy-D-xylo-4-hexulose-3-dehydrase